MAKHHIILFAVAAAAAFFLRATFSAWPGFSTVYNLTYSGGSGSSSTSSATGA